MSELKKSHLILGKDSSTFNFRSNSLIGDPFKTSRDRLAVPWTNKQSNVNLGTESFEFTSDYQARFQNTNSATNQSSVERIEIRAKMQSDAVTIGTQNAKLDGQTTTKSSFKELSFGKNL